MGDWLTPWVQPMMADDANQAATDAANNALSAQTIASGAAQQLQQDQFNYQKSLNDPFFKGGIPAYYQYLDAITGKRQTYADPNNPGAVALTPAEIKIQNYKAAREKDPNLAGMPDSILDTLNRNGYLPWSYQPGTDYYKSADGTISATRPADAMVTTTAFNPTETDAYKWQMQQAEKNNSRTLRALGRENSSYGMGEQFKSQQNLAATEYDKQLGRLADLTNIARGGASSLTGASNAFTNASNATTLGLGNNQANASLAGGMMQQNSLYNAQQNGMGLADFGLKAFNSFSNLNGSGGGDSSSSWGGSTGTIDNYNPNTVYAGSSPGPWAA